MMNVINMVGWPSELMTSLVQSSLIGAGVDRQPKPGRTHFGTVGALEGG